VTTRSKLSKRDLCIALWAFGGVALTFVEAVWRLGARALDTVREGLAAGHWLALIAIVLVLCYFEGYRALQRKFAPRVVARALEAGSQLSGCWPVIGAPLYALGLFGAPRATILRTWLGVAAIVGAVLIVRALPPVWRGIVDAGVAAALAWGLVALVVWFRGALRGELRTSLQRNDERASTLQRDT